MRIGVIVLIVSLMAGFSAGRPMSLADVTSKAFDCSDPNRYRVVEVRGPEANYVNIARGGKVLRSIRLPTGMERNGFGFNWAKKTKGGFEISVEYGSRFYYGKRFNFICKRGTFYLNKVIMDSFDENNPEKWHKRMVRVTPDLPLEKFSITDFMPEGVVK